MLHVHFHLDRQREQQRELARKLELHRLRTQQSEAPASRRSLERQRVLTGPFRRTAHRVRLLAVHAKCVVAGG